VKRPDELMQRWMLLGARLAEHDPERFRRVRALVETYVAIYEHPLEDEDTFQARLRSATPGGQVN
jgi:hypothetical protein